MPQNSNSNVGNQFIGSSNTVTKSNYTAPQFYVYGTPQELSIPKTVLMSGDLPSLLMEGHDDQGVLVKMYLAPESNISPNDCMKLLMLVLASNTAPEQFNALTYVKNNNLERHFNFT